MKNLIKGIGIFMNLLAILLATYVLQGMWVLHRYDFFAFGFFIYCLWAVATSLLYNKNYNE